MSAAPFAIPMLTADLSIALDTLGKVRETSFRSRCMLVQAVVDSGKSLDQMSVMEFVKIAQGVKSQWP